MDITLKYKNDPNYSFQSSSLISFLPGWWLSVMSLHISLFKGGGDWVFSFFRSTAGLVGAFGKVG